MSRIANRKIVIPPEVKINFDKDNKKIFFEGPLGKSQTIIIPPEMEIIVEKDKIITRSLSNIALTGTYNALIFNLIKGVEKDGGYKEILEIRGAGYRVSLKENNILEFNLGKSHPDYVTIPEGLKIKLEKNKLTIEGNDKQKVSAFAENNIRRNLWRMPSVYKVNKGIYNLKSKEIKIKPGKALSK